MGFDIVAGFDNWEEARVTYSKNQPDAWVPEKYSDIPRFQSDIVRLIRDRIGDIDVIIGGPPCVEYSSSKKGGNGDVRSGLEQVRAFFEIVKKLEPDYWIMENVPRIESFMEDAIASGYLDPPAGRRRWVFDSQYHKVPQSRRRLFTGCFPGEVVSGWEERRKKSRDFIPMKCVVEGYPNCLRKPRPANLSDPLYRRLTRKETMLTDHFGYGPYLRLCGLEKQMNLDLKQHHRQYGRMDFPENLDRPSRTIMATQLAVSRESIIVNDPHRHGGLRRLTPRECASLQGYPMTYQFWGNTVGSKYRLIGNSVPVGLARDLAISILIDRNLPVPRFPLMLPVDPAPAPSVCVEPRRIHVLREDFQWHPVRSMVRGCRVDLDNTQRYVKGPSSFPSLGCLKHLRRWDAVLHVGVGRPRWRYEQIEEEPILRALQTVRLDSKRTRQLLRAVKSLHGKVPDASSLVWAHQHPSASNWRYSVNGIPRPRFLLDLVDEMRKRVVGDLKGLVDCSNSFTICPERGLPSDVVVAGFILYWMCREINSCTAWMTANQGKYSGYLGFNDKVRVQKCLGVLSDDFPSSID